MARLQVMGLPKAKGQGVRPVGGYPALLRLFLEARRADFQAFDRAIDRDFFSASAGMSAADVAWRLSCEGEAAHHAEQHFALIA